MMRQRLCVRPRVFSNDVEWWMWCSSGAYGLGAIAFVARHHASILSALRALLCNTVRVCVRCCVCTCGSSWRYWHVAQAQVQMAAGILTRRAVSSSMFEKRPRLRARSAPPPRRLVAEGTDREPSGTSSTSERLPVVWQVETYFKYRSWTDYAPDLAEALEQAWESNLTRVVLARDLSEGRRDAWVVDFVRMMQQNQTTGTFRRVRRMLTSHA